MTDRIEIELIAAIGGPSGLGAPGAHVEIARLRSETDRLRAAVCELLAERDQLRSQLAEIREQATQASEPVMTEVARGLVRRIARAGMDMDIQAWQRTASALRGVCGAAWPVCEERMGTIPPADPDRWCPRCGWARHIHPGQTP